MYYDYPEDGFYPESEYQEQIDALKEAIKNSLTLPMPKGRGFSVLPSQPCICKVLYKVPERSVRACPALP